MTVSINGTSGLTFNDASTQNTAATGFGFKNRIINGAMMIDQRNNGASVSVGNSATVDRFGVRLDTPSGNTAQQSTTAPTGFKNSLVVTIGTGASPTSGQRNYISQAIEGLNVADLGWGTASASTITLSFWVRSSLTGTFGGALQNSAGDRSYPFTYTINSANTWEYETITIAGDTTGTWLTTNGLGILVYIGLGNGSQFNGTAGAWASADYRSATGATNVVATSGATFFLTGVQLEKGSTATSFDYRPYGTELALCQRYYAKLQNDGSGSDTTLGIGTQTITTNAACYINFPVTMRSEPTVTISNLVISDYFAFSNAATLTNASMGYNSGTLICSYSSAGAQFRPVYLAISSGTSGNIALSSEL